MTLITDKFELLAHTVAAANGVEGLPVLIVEHPIVGPPADEVALRADAGLDFIVAGLRDAIAAAAAVEAPAMPVLGDGPEALEPLRVADSLHSVEEINDAFDARGWTDGLPVVPPLDTTVRRFLDAWGRDPGEIVTVVPPEFGAATLEKVAVNMVMAGCLPEYLPVVEAALLAMSEERFAWTNSIVGTGLQAPLAIVSGPFRHAIGLNAGRNAYGPGPRANASIGRALRLIFRNVGGLHDHATQGNPAKYSFLLVENQEANPWSPLHTDYGFAEDDSVVTVVTGQPPMLIHDAYSRTGVSVMNTICNAIAVPDSVNYNQFGDQVLVLTPEHAAILAGDGFGKAEVRRYIHENARVPVERFSPAFIEKHGRHRFAGTFDLDDPQTRIPIVERLDDIVVMVAGGAGQHSSFIPTYGQSRRAARKIEVP